MLDAQDFIKTIEDLSLKLVYSVILMSTLRFVSTRGENTLSHIVIIFHIQPPGSGTPLVPVQLSILGLRFS